jgi:hypothetical protein
MNPDTWILEMYEKYLVTFELEDCDESRAEFDKVAEGLMQDAVKRGVFVFDEETRLYSPGPNCGRVDH